MYLPSSYFCVENIRKNLERVQDERWSWVQQGPLKCLGPCLERCTAAGLLLWRGGRIAIRGPTNLQKPPKLRNGNYQGVQAAK